MTSDQSESEILAAILLDLGGRPGIRLWRNNIGTARDAKGHWIKYGIQHPGGSDLLGWVERGGVYVFTALEVKTPSGRVTPDQQAFVDAVSVKGIAAVVRSVEDARRALGLPVQ